MAKCRRSRQTRRKRAFFRRHSRGRGFDVKGFLDPVTGKRVADRSMLTQLVPPMLSHMPLLRRSARGR